MGGSNDTPDTTTTVQDAPAYIKPYLVEAANAASREFKQGPAQSYQGNTIVPLNDYQQQYLNNTLNTANSDVYQQLGTDAAAANTYAMNLPQNIMQNQQLKDMMAANEQSVQENLVENTLRTIRGDAVASGNLDNSRTSIAEGNAIEGAAQELASSNANLMNTAYNDALKYSTVAQGNVGATQNALTSADQLIGGVGDTYAAIDQAELDQVIANYYTDQNAEYDNISQYINLLNGATSGGTTTQTTPQQKTNPFNSVLGAASTGLGAASMATGLGAASMATPIGWGAAGLSLLASL